MTRGNFLLYERPSDNNLLFIPHVDDPDLDSKEAELTFVSLDLKMLHKQNHTYPHQFNILFLFPI